MSSNLIVCDKQSQSSRVNARNDVYHDIVAGVYACNNVMINNSNFYQDFVSQILYLLFHYKTFVDNPMIYLDY